MSKCQFLICYFGIWDNKSICLKTRFGFLALVSVIWEVNGRLADLILEKESLEDVGDLAVVTQLANHVVEVGNLIGDV